MAAATPFSPSSMSSICSCSSKLLKPESKTLDLPLGFLSSYASRTALYSLKTRASIKNGFGSGHGSALGARMVSAPPMKAPTILDFETSVFNKEKISLAGHEEVLLYSFHLMKTLRLFLIFFCLSIYLL